MSIAGLPPIHRDKKAPRRAGASRSTRKKRLESDLDRDSARWHRCAPDQLLTALSKVQMCQDLCNDCRFKALETQIDGHLDLVTAILARPDMTNFVVAHVCRPLWCDQ